MSNKCLKCGKALKPIKNDFSNRKYHKKCYFEMLDDKYYDNLNNQTNKTNAINDLVNRTINPESYKFLDKLNNDFKNFLDN